MVLKIIKLYESGTTDGYTTQGEGLFFLRESEAETYTENKHKGYGRVIAHSNVAEIDGEYYLLKSKNPITLASTIEAQKKLKEEILKKLTDEEQKILGLK